MNNKILFDGIATQGTKKNPFHGGGEYAKYIFKEALKNGYKFDIVFRNDFIFDNEIIDLLKDKTYCKIHYVNDYYGVFSLIDKNKYSTFYSALPYPYTNFSFSNTKFIQVIHGLRPIELPWDFNRFEYYDRFLKRIVARFISSSKKAQYLIRKRHISNFKKLLSIPNSRFITVSQHSKFALINFFPFLNSNDISVYYSPFEIESYGYNNKIITNDYYLMVNGNRFEKNIYRAMKAFDKLISDGHLKEKKVIITGSSKLAFIKKIKNKDHFILLPYVSKSKLDELYRNAYSFVYPSLNEGFGYPPLKAMGYGVPVIASAVTSIPEVCNDASIYFNPLSIDEMCNRILQIEYNHDLRKALIVRGFQQVNYLLNAQEDNLKRMIKEIFADETI